MSTNRILRGSLIAAFGIAGLATTADAQSRYGSVYDYESGKCGNACAAPAPVQSYSSQSSRYGAGVTQPAYAAPSMHVSPGPVYVDCRAMGTCAPQPQTVYSQPTTYAAPVQSYQTQSYQAPAPSYQAPSYQTQAPANCPSGTTAQSDGTCMETSYSAPTSSYSSPSYSSGSSSYGTSAPANCPSGTTAQSDGTCMESSGSSYSSSDSGSSYGSGSSYSSGSSSYGSGSSYSGGTPTNCPSGTTAQSDGTCMEGGSSSYSNAYTGSSVELYTGDASATPSYGYSSDGSYGASDYLPIRK